MSLLRRYLEGDCEQVWRSLSTLTWNEIIERGYSDDVHQIIQHAMERVRTNIEMLIHELQQIGYVFGYSWADDLIEAEKEELRRYEETPQDPAFLGIFGTDETTLEAELPLWISEQPPLFSPPIPNTDDLLASLEMNRGYLPLSIKQWYKTIGSVNFVGQAPSTWSHTQPERDYAFDLDPLFVRPLDEKLIKQTAYWGYLPFAPDAYEKYYSSGGGGVQSYLEFTSSPNIDGLIQGSWLKLDFIEYLRLALSWCGFPGLGRMPNRPDDDIKRISAKLIEF